MRQAYDAANASVALRDAGAIGGVALNNPGSRPRTKFGRLLRGKRMDSLMKEVKGYGVLPGHLDKKIEFLLAAMYYI